MRSDFVFPGNKMSTATKEKRFQWNKGDKIENLILCLANLMEYKNIDFNADKVKQYEATRRKP